MLIERRTITMDTEREYSGSDQLFTLASIISSVVRVIWIHLLLESCTLFLTLIVSARVKCLLLEEKLLLSRVSNSLMTKDHYYFQRSISVIIYF